MGKQVSWTQEQKNQAAIQYAIEGSLQKIEHGPLHIPHQTVSTWKGQEWWVETVSRIRHEKLQEHVAKYNQMVDLAQDKALELIPNMKSAKEATLVACMSNDKSLLLQGKPTSISGKAESMSGLAQEFKKLSAKWDEKQVKVVSTQEDTQVIDK